MSVKTNLRRELDEIAALDTLRETKVRRAGKTLARLRELYPHDWQRMAKIDAVTADHLLKAAGHGDD